MPAAAQQPPERFDIADAINWNANWVQIQLWIELPFWLMVNNAVVPIEIEGHIFTVELHDNYYELHVAQLTDSKSTTLYQGPLKRANDLPSAVQEVLKSHPNLPHMWRKCKTVMKIASRCNEDVWTKATTTESSGTAISRTTELYLAELCEAHIPVINKLILTYRLATYDYFAFEVAPWDVPRWLVFRDGACINAQLIPYRTWDDKPLIDSSSFQNYEHIESKPMPYQLITAEDFNAHLSTAPTPGETEVLDALNFMERGDYSGAVRRITTAIEVVVEAMVYRELESTEGKQSANSFMKATRTNFPRRIAKYEELTKRKLDEGSRKQLDVTRALRHRIVHQGYRIALRERGHAQRSVDTGRWIFNWFENNAEKRNARESKIGFRSLGRNLAYGVFPTRITPDGVEVSRPQP